MSSSLYFLSRFCNLFPAYSSGFIKLHHLLNLGQTASFCSDLCFVEDKVVTKFEEMSLPVILFVGLSALILRTVSLLSMSGVLCVAHVQFASD